MPIATCALVAGVLFGNALAALWPSVHDAFVRRPGAVADGQIWRVVTPLVVQTDGVLVLGAVVVWLLIAGTIVERAAGAAWVVGAFFAAGIVGHSAALAWQPHGGGASVGMCGPLGMIVVFLLRPRDQLGPMARLLGAAGLTAGAVLAFTHDVHGPALLAGAAVGAVWLAGMRHLAPTGRRGVDELLALAGPV